MEKQSRIILLALFLSLICQMTNAQNETRRWAFEGQIGPTFIKNKSGVHDIFGVDNGVSNYVGVEYFIPWTHFSARLGYKNNELNMAGQLVQAEYSEVSLGGRWYPGNEEWFVQPHVGLNVNVKTTDDSTSHITGFMNGLGFDYASKINTPAVSFSPTIGLDIYALSSVAFTLSYSYQLGIGSRYKIYDNLSSSPETPIAKGTLNHHSINFGVKVTLPFRFTNDDGRCLLLSAFETIISRHRH